MLIRFESFQTSLANNIQRDLHKSFFERFSLLTAKEHQELCVQT